MTCCGASWRPSRKISASVGLKSSALSCYRLRRWGGVQTFRLAEANKASRDSSQQLLLMMQLRTFDASMFLNYIEARNHHDDKVEKFLYDRFRPEMRKAMDAWLKTDPENNSAAPKTPFHIPEYVQKEELEAKSYSATADERLAAAQEANENSDRYVLLTVLFGTVLFLGGIAGTIDAASLRTTLAILALILFIAMAIFLATMPLCTE
jgi:hypothetical protein